jgi:hypothetical protein
VTLTVIDDDDAEDSADGGIKVGDPGTAPVIEDHELYALDLECWNDYEDKDLAIIICADFLVGNILFEDEAILIWFNGTDPDIDVDHMIVSEYLLAATGKYILYRGPEHYEVTPNYWEKGGVPYGDFDILFVPTDGYRPKGKWQFDFEITDFKNNTSVYSIELEVVELIYFDLEPPTLGTMSFEPSTVHVRDANDSTNFRILLRDNEELARWTSDVVAEAWVESPSKQTTIKVTVVASDTIEGGETESTYLSPMIIPKGSELGDWVVSKLDIWDKAGNTASYSYPPLGYPLQVRE